VDIPSNKRSLFGYAVTTTISVSVLSARMALITSTPLARQHQIQKHQVKFLPFFLNQLDRVFSIPRTVTSQPA